MRYKADDLDVFELIRDKQQLDGTAYFELHPSELPEPHDYWLEGSIFVRDASFEFFVGCFHQSHPQFGYFENTRFGLPQIAALTNQLSALISELIPGCTREVIFSRYKSIYGRSIWTDVATESLRAAVAATGIALRDFIHTSTIESRCLWVLGM